MVDADRHRPRYLSRAVTDDESIRRFLERHAWGVLVTVDRDEPVPTPLLYVYEPDPHAIAVHVSPAGRTAAVASDGSPGAFTVATMGEIIHAREAAAFDTEYESVVAHGVVELLEADDAKRSALARLMAKYAPRSAPGEDYRSITDEEIDRTAVVRLSIEDWSGKRNEAALADETAPFDPEWRSAQD
ncbi:Nitroimidazol reductase NimA or a related FMN-containing flavoprotein, pyridoxamine 5'-phosphate oxidase superfamily [Halanaeroarchaeum sp. HSR-CO]|uniref:pyridoxamine 5'-phosphate oxidase family protein n=1 Tax=Halanaeroarchaeum sp. HSR-CO TaxID=2866382 RepID=UPI00217EA45D|nr:pyridoxamine 5'-phosphate oxidase family protein [Halanaeroarchaeum sp. HSR-CO]UWG48868.1 Nitroimidazol reductase NimA or a related FMN-containing flavoprotein, pyridoxamine 5'-phosphate oxidase superfamily [Halanaeroarchaeum sp. HSR-CO]